MLNISEYKILERINEGNTSTVYRAVGEDKQKYILKVLKQDYSNLENVNNKLINEYQYLKEINSEGVIKTYGLKSIKGKTILLLEDFNAVSLKSFLKNTPTLNMEIFLRIAIKIVQALNDIHSYKIIHRDIRPDNILINPQDLIIKFIDFGFASNLNIKNNKIPLENYDKDNLKYISPEQTGRTNQIIDTRTDFYSLGVVFYEMLAGHIPFESNDSMEIIHHHIAKRPSSPNQINSIISKPVSDIVMKMLEKDINDRYKTAQSIVFDLKLCLNNLIKKTNFEDFIPGSYDINDQINISQEIYAKYNVLEKIIEKINKPENRNNLFLLTGDTGFGKSFILEKIYSNIDKSDHKVILVKFDKNKINIPYACLTESLSIFIKNLMIKSRKDEINAIKEKINKNIGKNINILNEKIPEISLITGDKRYRDEGLNNRSNFGLLIKSLIQIIKDNSLTMCIDNPEYADLSSTELIQSMVSDKNFHNFNLIITNKENNDKKQYTSNLAKDNSYKIDIKKGFKNFKNDLLKSAKRNEFNIYEAKLEKYESEEIIKFLIDSFDYNFENIEKLAKIIYSKTNGNPFFVNEFIKKLYDRKIICFEHGKGWKSDLKLANSMHITENVIDSILEKIQFLTKPELDKLKFASCIGKNFNTDILVFIYDTHYESIQKILQKMIEIGIINSDGKVNSFTHEKIYESIYAMLDYKEKGFFHYKIGKYFKGKIKDYHSLSEAVNHLNYGIDYVDDQVEKIELAKLNLELAKKVKNNLTYNFAADYFKIAINLVEDDIWENDYNFAFELYLQYAEIEYLNFNFENSERVLDIVFDKCISNYEKALVCESKTILYITTNELKKATNIGLLGLKLMDIRLPTNKFNIRKEILKGLLKNKYLFKKIGLDSILDLPEMNNQKLILVMNIMVGVVTATYMSDTNLMILLVQKMVNLSLKNGNSNVSAYAYSAYAAFSAYSLGEYKTSYKLGRVSLLLLEKFDSLKIKCKVNFIYSNLIHDWYKHDREDIEIISANIKLGSDTGDLIYGSYSALHLIIKKFIYGDDLDSIHSLIKDTSSIIFKTNDSNILESFLLRTQFILSLKGLTNNYLSLSDNSFNEEKFFYLIKKTGNISTLAHAYAVKLQMNYFFGNYIEALEYAEEMKKYIMGCYSNNMIPEFYFFYSLAITSLCIKNPRVYKNRKYLSIVKNNQAKMRKWSESCPESFLHRYLLVEAELSYIANDYNKASELYNKSIYLANENGFIHYQGLANELAAKFYLNRDYEIIAKEYITEAHACYIKWGAKVKVVELENKYPYFFDNQEQVRIDFKEEYKKLDSKLDIETFMKVSQTLSEEIFPDKLIDKLMKIVLENAGAERGVLLLKNDKNLFIQAEGNINQEKTNLFSSGRLDLNENIPHSVINYVERTGNDVIIDDVLSETTFTADYYIINKKPKSILCIPINKQQKLIGILYLENTLIKGAFTSDRIQLLKLIASQAAISLENARLYDEMRELNIALEQNKNNLEDMVDKRTKQLKLTQKKLIDSAHQSGMAEIATGVLHNIGNILNGVNISNQLISETIENSKVEGLVKANNLLNQNINNLPDFLNNDPKGKKLFQYYISIGDLIKKEIDLINKESKNLSNRISLMKDVIVTQQNYAKLDFLTEKIDLITIIEDALAIQMSSLIKNNIKVIKNYSVTKEINVQKSKLINIIINLLKNSEEALDKQTKEKIIKVEVSQIAEKNILIKITDNGEGIPKENINRIFNHGFTTKSKGHGFGLHICANSMTEMGGKISVISDGLDKGSVFILSFPID